MDCIWKNSRNNLDNMPSFDIENSFDYKIIAGIDEAGRGPLCGPVFAACAIIPDRNIYPKAVDDSKKLTEKHREEIFEEILELESKSKIFFGIGQADVEEIELINIRNATKLAMGRAYYQMVEKYSIDVDLVLVDGNFIPELNTKAEYIIKGDQKSISIAAASVIAKVSRDKLLIELDRQYPQYNWRKNKGYGTREHIDAIKKYGMCEIHRKSFIHL